MFIDTHCHLNFKAFKKDLPQVLERAAKAGVEKIIIPGAKIDSSNEAIKIATLYKSCFAAIGIHPHHTVNKIDKVKEILSSLAKKSKVVAIGEIGFDYHRYRDYPPVSTSAKKAQKELFQLQLKLAKETHLPVIIHCRNAYEDLLKLLLSSVSKKTINGVFHCFEGNRQQLAAILDLGFYVGFDGNITYPENHHLRDLVKLVPLDRLLLETDAPFLTPLAFRRQRNEPSFIVYTAQCVAEVKQKSLREISTITSQNTQRLFSI